MDEQNIQNEELHDKELSPLKEVELRAIKILQEYYYCNLTDDEFIEQFDEVRNDIVKLTTDENGNIVTGMKDDPVWIYSFYAYSCRDWRRSYLYIKEAKKVIKHFTPEDWEKVDKEIRSQRNKMRRDIYEYLIDFYKPQSHEEQSSDEPQIVSVVSQGDDPFSFNTLINGD